jgi:hypothetical protein
MAMFQFGLIALSLCMLQDAPKADGPAIDFQSLPKEQKKRVHSLSIRIESNDSYKALKTTKLKFKWDKVNEFEFMRSTLADWVSTTNALFTKIEKDGADEKLEFAAFSILISGMMAFEKVVVDEFGEKDARSWFEQCVEPDDFAEWLLSARTGKKMDALKQKYIQEALSDLDKQK